MTAIFGVQENHSPIRQSPPEGNRRGGSHPAGLSVIRTRGTLRVARAFEGSVARAWPKPKKVTRRVMIETIRFDSFHL